MAVSDHVDFATFMEGVKRRNPGQPEFVQAVQEVSEDIFDFIARIDHHRFARSLVSDDRAVALQRADRENFVDHLSIVASTEL